MTQLVKDDDSRDVRLHFRRLADDRQKRGVIIGVVGFRRCGFASRRRQSRRLLSRHLPRLLLRLRLQGRYRPLFENTKDVLSESFYGDGMESPVPQRFL